VEKQTLQAATKRPEAIARGGRLLVLAPLVKARKGFHTEVARWAMRHGFEDLLVDGKMMKAEGFQKLDRFREHSIDVVVGERSSPARVQGADQTRTRDRQGHGEGDRRKESHACAEHGG
jgi:excinuclease ABC subunit A